MNKLDLAVINNIKTEYKDEKNLNLDIVELLYLMYKNDLLYDPNNYNFINKDQVIVSSSIAKIYENVMNYFYKDKVLYEYRNINDIFGLGAGIALGKRYLDTLVKMEIPKCNLISNRVICLCKYDELLNDYVFDSISYINSEKLNKMVFIVIKDNYDTCKEDLVDRFSFLNFTIEEINGISKLTNILEDSKKSKCPTIVFMTLKNSRKISQEKNIVDKKDVINEVEKRLSKDLTKWNSIRENAVQNPKVKDIIEFLEKKNFKINYKAENIKLNDNYEEKISQSNNKIFNLFTSKNPFILNLSDTNLLQINKALLLDKSNPTGRNLILKNRLSLICNLSIGLAHLGFKVFINTNLSNSGKIYEVLNICNQKTLDIDFILFEDNNSINYVDSFNYLNNVISFRPCDINEIIGVYDVLKDYKKTTILFISSLCVKELKGTNYRYVQAGCYPVKKETDSLNGILLASGFNVLNAINLADSLASLGIILRVVSMPSLKVFDMQTPKYQSMLIPNTKIFILDMYNTSNNKKFIKNNEYIINNENLEDAKRKIVDLMKN